MTVPDAVAAMQARIASIAQRPSAITDLNARFAALLGTAVQAEPVAPADSAPATTGSWMTSPAMAVPQVSRGSTVSTTSGSYTPLTGATPRGDWVGRIPNERGTALAPAIQAAADRYGLDPAFLAAVYWTESSYTPNAVSKTGAIGLGQLMPETAQWLGVDPWDPMQNIDGSARLYRYFLDKNDGNVELAIASYAAGPGAVKRAGGVPDEFTAKYIVKLLGRRDYLNGVRADAP